jgi:hypothetical protein
MRKIALAARGLLAASVSFGPLPGVGAARSGKLAQRLRETADVSSERPLSSTRERAVGSLAAKPRFVLNWAPVPL